MKNVFYALLFVLTISCLSDNGSTVDTSIDFAAQNEQEILAYIAENNLDAQRSATGLHYVINEPGTGAQPDASSTVTVSYRGFFTDGRVFDESDENGISFGLQQVIEGWTQGIPLFKEGGSGILLIPSSLAYGNSGITGIPGGSVLVFEITLITVN